MKKLLMGITFLATFSSYALEITQKCHVYQFVSESGYLRYEKIDTLDLDARTSEYGRPIQGLDNVGLRVRKDGEGTMNVLLVKGHNFTMPPQIYVDLSANVSQRPLNVRVPVKEDMLSLNCGEIE